MSNSEVQNSARLFNDGRGNVHEESRCDQPYLINDDLPQATDHKKTGHSQFPTCL